MPSKRILYHVLYFIRIPIYRFYYFPEVKKPANFISIIIIYLFLKKKKKKWRKWAVGEDFKQYLLRFTFTWPKKYTILVRLSHSEKRKFAKKEGRGWRKTHFLGEKKILPCENCVFPSIPFLSTQSWHHTPHNFIYYT